MHSSKNTMVAILLLGVSYGVYQIMTAPVPELTKGLDLQISTGETQQGDTLGDPGSDSRAEIATTTKASPPSRPMSPGFEVGSRGFAPPPLDIESPSDTTPPPSSVASSNRTFDAQDNGFAPNLDTRSEPDFLPTPPRDLPQANRTASPLSTASAAAPATSLAPLEPKSETDASTNSADYPNLRRSLESAEFAAPLQPLSDAWPTVEHLVNTGEMRQALKTLTPYCDDRRLTDEERERVLIWLDALATKVIYSTEHHFANAAYVVQPQDSLDTISQAWKVPVRLIYNINQAKIANPIALTAGVELKRVTGPFEAVVDCESGELTLRVDGLYAGRFEITQCASDLMPGEYVVENKLATDPQSGEFSVQLDCGWSLHAESGRGASSGIGFRMQDAHDIFDILSVGSRVTVR